MVVRVKKESEVWGSYGRSRKRVLWFGNTEVLQHLWRNKDWGPWSYATEITPYAAPFDSEGLPNLIAELTAIQRFLAVSDQHWKQTPKRKTPKTSIQEAIERCNYILRRLRLADIPLQPTPPGEDWRVEWRLRRDYKYRAAVRHLRDKLTGGFTIEIRG